MPCIILHGCPSNKEKAMDTKTRTYDKHWMPWIKKQLTEKGIEAQMPMMPSPWQPVYEDFKKAFLNLDLPNRDLENARRNIALIRTQIIMDQEPSARANFQYIMEQQYKETFTQGMYPTYRLLNPFNWAEFFKALKRGDFRFNKDD